jgi:magnesium transporter
VESKAEETVKFGYKEALALAGENSSLISEKFSAMHSAEVAELLLACRDDRERHLLIPFIPETLLGDTLLELPEGMQEDLLANFAPSKIEDVVEHLESDEATDILQAVDKNVADEVIERLDPDEQREIKPLMAHDEESAGGLMQAELFKVRSDWKVEKVLNVLRRWGEEIWWMIVTN